MAFTGKLGTVDSRPGNLVPGAPAPVTAAIPVNLVTANSGAAANILTLTSGAVGLSVPSGDTVFVVLCERHITTAPTFSSVTDSKGNTYTLDKSGGNSAITGYIARSVLTTALVAGVDTITATFTTTPADELLMVADTIAGSAALDGAARAFVNASLATTHTVPSTSPTATDLVYGMDCLNQGIGPPSSIANGTQLGTTSTPANRGLVSWYNLPGVTTAVSTTVTWPSAHVGSINGISYVVTPSQPTASGSLSLGGSAGAAAPVTAASGSLSLGSTASGRAAAPSATGTLSLTGAATWTVSAVAGSLTLTGSATPAAATPAASGALTLSGTATSSVPSAASGSLALAGTAAPAAPVTAAGALLLSASGSAAGIAPATATGTLSITGTAAARVPSSAAGALILTMIATAQARAAAIRAVGLAVLRIRATDTSSVRGKSIVTGTSQVRNRVEAKAGAT